MPLSGAIEDDFSDDGGAPRTPHACRISAGRGRGRPVLRRNQIIEQQEGAGAASTPPLPRRASIATLGDGRGGRGAHVHRRVPRHCLMSSGTR